MTSYRIWPSTNGPGSAAFDSSTYTLGMAFTVSQSCTLNAIWFWSAADATELPGAVAVFAQTSGNAGSIVESITSPTWSGAAASGWVSVTMSGSTTLSAGTNYKTCVLKGTATNNVYSATANYWDTGAGSAGLTNGPLSALSSSAASAATLGGQDTFLNPAASLGWPTTAFNAGNYWVDVEVTPASGTNAPAGLAAATGVPPSDTADSVRIGMTIRGS